MGLHSKHPGFAIRFSTITWSGVMLVSVFAWLSCSVLAHPLQKSSASGTPLTEKSGNQQEEEKLAEAEVSIARSRVYIFVDKTGFGHQHGVEGRLKSGHLLLGREEEAGELIFDMTTFDADTDAARRYVGLQGSTDFSTRRQVNENMKNTQILNVSQFPTARFVIKSATLLEKKTPKGIPMYELAGEFTLRGRTRPLKFEAEAEEKNGLVHVRGRFAILQTQYGISPFRKALGTIGVADQLVIHGDLWVAASR